AAHTGDHPTTRDNEEMRMSPKYAIGIDFGTESGRALLVDVADGREAATAVHDYKNGVIDETLPDSNIRLEPDWALQDPNDYIEDIKHSMRDVLKPSVDDRQDVIGIDLNFTTYTMIPVKADDPPVSKLPEYRQKPHA